MRIRPLAVVSDLHCNSYVGLYPPDVELKLEMGGMYVQNKYQAWLWVNFLDFCKAVPNDAVVEINGDVFQGIKPFRDSALITVSATDQLRIAQRVIKPLLARASRIYVVRGTDFHDGVIGADIEMFAEAIGAEQDADTGQYSRWELTHRHGKTLFHFTHHVSSAPVYPSTPMARAMKEAKEAFVDDDLPIPDVMIRSHIHTYRKFIDRNRWFIITPAWQLQTGYSYKVAPRKLPSIGGLIFDVNGEQVTWREKLYPLPKPQITTSR